MSKATQAKKSAPKKITAKKRGGSPKKQPPVNIKSSEIFGEIIIIAVIAFSCLMLFSIISDATGALGYFLNMTLFGLFGVGAFIIPFLLIAYFLFVLIKEKKAPTYKIVTTIILVLSILAFAHTIVTDDVSYLDIVNYSINSFENGAGTNGGFFGAVFSNALIRFLGKTGTYIILIAVFISCAILITGRSFFAEVTKLYSATAKVQEPIKEAIKNRREKAPIKKMETLNAPIVIDTTPVVNEKKPFDYEKEVGGNFSDLPEIPKVVETQKQKYEIEIPSMCETAATIDPPKQDDAASSDGFNPDDILFDLPADTHELNNILSNKTEAKPLPTTPNIGAEKAEYVFPDIRLIKPAPPVSYTESKEQMLKSAKKLEETLMSFGVDAKVVQINKGPTVTRYELSPRQGVKVSKIVNLADDIALNLAAAGIRIEAPIPGKAVVGIEVPNKEQQPVSLREVLEDHTFKDFPSNVAFAVGKDIAGMPVVADIGKMPHLLIAGATGAGKSVCINTLITSILYKSRPEDVKLLMIDPKVVELSVYNGIPHLLIPVVTDAKKAAGALNWAVTEMLNRYKGFAEYNVRDVKGYNNAKIERGEEGLLPQIVIIIDELADLMMASPKEVEESICRLAQMARAAGLHLIIATQRPSVDVITGVIKANIPSRLAFSVSSGTDSRTILDMVGAEKLLGKGDMLFYPVGMSKPVRIQGAFISDKEVESIVNHLKTQVVEEIDPKMAEIITSAGKNIDAQGDDDDEFTDEAIGFIVEKQKASVSLLQRQFRIGYNRAARLMQQLEERGVVGPEDGSKPRKVLMTKREYEEWQERKLL